MMEILCLLEQKVMEYLDQMDEGENWTPLNSGLFEHITAYQF